MISLVRLVTEQVKPARALWVPFPFGRPQGLPNRPDIQMDVLRRTLALVDEPSGPTLLDYPDDGDDESTDDTAWSCPVTFPAPVPETESDALIAQVRQEAQLLRPWFDEGVRTRGRTTVGTSGKDADSIDEMLEILVRFAVECNLSQPEGYAHPMPQLLRYITDDVRDFYYEASTSKPGVESPSPSDLLEWFFLQTVAGDVYYQMHEKVLAADVLVLMAKGLEDDVIENRLSLSVGTMATIGNDVLRNPGISRELLQKSTEVFLADQPNRLSNTVVPLVMRGRRSERASAPGKAAARA